MNVYEHKLKEVNDSIIKIIKNKHLGNLSNSRMKYLKDLISVHSYLTNNSYAIWMLKNMEVKKKVNEETDDEYGYGFLTCKPGRTEEPNKGE